MWVLSAVEQTKHACRCDQQQVDDQRITAHTEVTYTSANRLTADKAMSGCAYISVLLLLLSIHAACPPPLCACRRRLVPTRHSCLLPSAWSHQRATYWAVGDSRSLSQAAPLISPRLVKQQYGTSNYTVDNCKWRTRLIDLHRTTDIVYMTTSSKQLTVCFILLFWQ